MLWEILLKRFSATEEVGGGPNPENDSVQWRSQPKFWGADVFDFRQATVFLFGTPLLKPQND